MIDTKAIREVAVVTSDSERMQFKPSTVIALLDRLEAAEKDAAQKVIRVKLGNQYGNDLHGHWFYLHPADDEAQKVLDNRSMKK